MAVPTNGWHPQPWFQPSLATPCGTWPAATLVLACAVDVVLRIVEEDIGAETLAGTGRLWRPPRNSASIQAHAPFAQRADHPLMRRRRARGHQRRADRRICRPAGNTSCSVCSADRKPRNGPPLSGSRTFSLMPAETLPRPARARCARFTSPKITASPSKAMRSWPGRAGPCRSGSGRSGTRSRPCGLGRMVAAAMPWRSALPHRFRVGRQEQIGPERLHVWPGRLAGGEGGADDAQVVMLDGIEDAQAGIGRVARRQDDLHPRRFSAAGTLVERQQLAHHREGHARPEHIVLVLALVLGPLGGHAIALEQHWLSSRSNSAREVTATVSKQGELSPIGGVLQAVGSAGRLLSSKRTVRSGSRSSRLCSGSNSRVTLALARLADGDFHHVTHSRANRR